MLIFLICVFFGLLVGTLSGLLGIGGGVLIVPFIVFFFSTSIAEANLVPVAVATSITCIFLTTFSVAYAQIRKKAVYWNIIKVWTLPMMLGGFIASQLAGVIPGKQLLLAIALLLVLIGSSMIMRWFPENKKPLPGRYHSSCIATLIGIISGMSGMGGGNMVVPTLIYYQVPIVKATATAATLSVPMTLFAALGFIWTGWDRPDLPQWSLGLIYLPAVVGIASGSMLVAPFGVLLAHRLPTAKLRRVFAVFLIVISIFMASRALS